MSVAFHHFLNLHWSDHQNRWADCVMDRFAGQGISHTVGSTRLVHNAKLEAHQFREQLLLPRSMQALISQLN